MPPPETDNTFAFALSQAEVLLRADKAAEALKLYQSCLEQQPDNADAQYYGGIAALYTGDIQTAIDLLQAAVKTLPDRADIVNNLGAAYRQLGQTEQATGAFEKAIALDPECADAIYNLGDTLRDGGQIEGAMEAYKKVLKIDPNYIDAYINLGAIFAAIQMFPEAIQTFEHAIKIQPVAEAYNNLGTVMQRIKDFPAAIKNFHQAIALKPDYADAHYNLGMALILTEDYAAATDAFDKTIELMPEHVEAHACQGATLRELKQYERAIDAFRRALSLRPLHAAALRGLGYTYLDYGDLQEAEATYRLALKEDNDNVELLDCLGDVLQKQERFDDAAGMYERVLEIDPNNPTASHFAAALRGKNTAAPPTGYIRDLFNNFAPKFEETLLNELSYNVPELICQSLQHLQDENIITLPFKRALDLGCGTGLGGKALKESGSDFVTEIHGVDISSGMIVEAEKKQLYDSLNIAENIAFLEQSDTGIDNAKPFDFICAADVFVYVGGLEATFAAVHSRLAPSGAFAFSIETLDKGTYALHRTGRYAHHGEYVKTLAAKFGFNVQHCQEIVVRQDRGLPIAGLLFVLIRD